MAVANILLRISQSGISAIERRYASLSTKHAALRAQLQRSIRIGGEGRPLEKQLTRISTLMLSTKRRMREMGREAANTARRFNRMSQAVNRAQQGIGRFAGRVTQLTFTLGFMARILTDVATGLANTGGAVIGAQRAFKLTSAAVNETSDALLGRLKRASKGTISDFGLMSAANFAFLAGAKLTSDELNTLTEASVKLAAIGIKTSAGAMLNAEEIFNRFTQGIVKQERRIVDDMTVVIRAKDVMNEFGAAANAAAAGNANLARVIAFKMAIVKAASDRLETLRDVDISLVTVGSQLSAVFENFKNKLSEMFVVTGAGTRLLESVRGILEGIITRLSQPGEADKFFNSIVSAVTAMIRLFTTLVPVLIQVLGLVNQIVFAFAGLKVGGLLGSLLSLIPGVGIVGRIAAIALPAIGAAVGAGLAGGDDVTPVEAGREIGRAVEGPLNMNREQLATITRVVRNRVLQPAFPSAVV